MSNLNIVELIEKNPISQLSQTYNNKFLIKIKENFTESQQKLFISSFYCYLNHAQRNDFIINLDNIWNWLGFSKKVYSKVLLEKHFIINIDYILLDKENIKSHGGHNKEIIMLNIKTFKLLCLKAGTKKADEIHDYFIKLEEILQQTIGEECSELKTQLQQIKEDTTKNQKITQQLDREKMLLREFGTKGAIVYIIKVKTFESGEYIVKIGESRRGILNRYNEHKSHYEECLLLDCFSVKKSKDFESFIHDKIRFNKVTDLSNHEKERELFLIGKELSYDVLIQIINENIKMYDDTNENYVETYIDKLHTEIECLKNMLSNKENQNKEQSQITNTFIQPLSINNEQISQLSNQILNLEKSNREILEKLNSMQIKTVTGFNEPIETIGDRIQKINPDTLQIVKVYESIAEVIKESNFILKRPSIKKAILEYTIYHGFRWNSVDRNIDPTILNIQPTKKIRPQNVGYIAKLNAEKTRILNVYLDRKTAALKNGYESSSLDSPVTTGTIKNNHYYVLYEKCDDELKNAFIEMNGIPILYKNGIGQYDSNNVLIKEYVCKYDCIKQMKMSDKTLRKALDQNTMYNNFYFRELKEKIFL